MDLAATSLALWDDSTKKAGRAADTTTAAMKSHAKAAALLSDAESVLAGRATTTTKLIADQGTKFDSTAKKAANLAGEASGAAGSLGGLAGPSGMGAAIGAATLLSPVLVTVGTGLGGLALAAYGVAKPIENAAQKTGGLQANLKLLDPEQRKVAQGLLGLGQQYAGFEHQLQPVLLKDFSAAMRLAGTVLHETEPVAKSAGVALGGVLSQLGAEFSSPQWRSFFTTMSAQVGPDIRLIGASVVSLTDALPSLLRDLQPVATQLLTFTDDAAKLIDVSSRLSQQLDVMGHKADTSGGVMGFLAGKAKEAVGQLVPGIPASQQLEHWLGKLGGTSSGTATQLHATSQQAAAAAVQAYSLRDAVKALTDSESKSLDTQLAYSNSLVTSANDADALRKALKASHDEIGLHTAAERASFGAANTYISDLENTAKQSWASGHGTDGAIAALTKGLPILEQAKSKSREYWQEVQTLVAWLHKLQEQKRINEVVSMTGSGTWTVGKSSQYLHGLTGKGASGGFASGTPGAAPGWAWVGERGPELAYFHGGETVLSSPQSMRVAHGYASGTVSPSYSGSVRGLVPWSRDNRLTTIAAFLGAFGAEGRQLLSSVAAVGGSFSGSVGALQRYAGSLFPRFGWGASQLPPLIALWNRESGWNRFARNPSSGAYGIAQALPPTKYPLAGQAAGGSNAGAQIGWGESYIAGRYGSPAAAWAHELSAGWYANGTKSARPGWAVVGERGPELVKLRGGEQVYPAQAGGIRSGGVVKHIFEIRAPHGGTQLERAVADMVRHVVSVSGGDVQVALGAS